MQNKNIELQNNFNELQNKNNELIKELDEKKIKKLTKTKKIKPKVEIIEAFEEVADEPIRLSKAELKKQMQIMNDNDNDDSDGFGHFEDITPTVRP